MPFHIRCPKCGEKVPKIILNTKDAGELLALYRRAQGTPVIKMSMSSPSWADSAWEDVRRRMDELGKKYGFDPRKIKGIQPNGEVAQ